MSLIPDHPRQVSRLAPRRPIACAEIFMFMVEGKELRELRLILDGMIRPRLLAEEGIIGGETTRIN